MRNTRIAIAVPGVLLGLFGIFRLLTEVPNDDLVQLAIWLVVAVVLHDGVLSPIIVGVGWTIAKVVPARGRAYVQGGLITAALVTTIALPMIYRGDVQPASKAVLKQNYSANLLIVFALVVAVVLAAYLISLVRGQRVSSAKVRSPHDQDSSTE